MELVISVNVITGTDSDVNMVCCDFSIADALMDDLLEGVAVEVGQVCDGCVENLYGSEFLRPP